MSSSRPFRVYDKVSWHYPEGQGCASVQAAKRHINFAMRFLESHGLLSEDGRALFAGGWVDDNFALTSEMVTAEGDAVLAKAYRDWLKQIDYTGPLTSELFERALMEVRSAREEKR